MVQTGVKSAGCENKIHQELPMYLSVAYKHLLCVPCDKRAHSWKSILPCVVSAVKLGALDPKRRRGCSFSRNLGRAAKTRGVETKVARGAALRGLVTKRLAILGRRRQRKTGVKDAILYECLMGGCCGGVVFGGGSSGTALWMLNLARRRLNFSTGAFTAHHSPVVFDCRFLVVVIHLSHYLFQVLLVNLGSAKFKVSPCCSLVIR